MVDGDLVAGVDVGGTNLRVAIARAEDPARFLAHRAGPMPTPATPEACVALIGLFLDTCCAEAGVERRRVAAVASTVPGITDDGRGTTLIVTNLPGWDNYPFAALLASGLGIEAYIENDVNAAALAEYFYGVGAGAH
ncbi:MAG: ROK family protein, partial [Rhodothermales bacterium]|nr:ROK family protein [Rhodothermales bacterium]